MHALASELRTGMHSVHFGTWTRNPACTSSPSSNRQSGPGLGRQPEPGLRSPVVAGGHLLQRGTAVGFHLASRPQCGATGTGGRSPRASGPGPSPRRAMSEAAVGGAR